MKKTSIPSSKKTLWISSAIAVAAIFGGSVGYLVHKQNQQVELLTTTLLTMQQNQANTQAAPTPELRAEEVANAVEQALQNRVLAQQQQAREERLGKYTLADNNIPDDKHIYGNYNARFTLVEFSDIECPYCKRFHDTPKNIVDQSQGHVNWQWKHLPLSFHNPTSERQAQATECVKDLEGNQMFWVYLDELFKQTRGGGQGANVVAIAQDLGVDVNAFTSCLNSGKFQEKVQSDVAQATKMGITGTPATFIVDNQTGKTQFLSGAQPEEAILAAIRKIATEAEETKNG